MNHIKLGLSNIIVKVNRFLRIVICCKILLRFPCRWKQWLKNPSWPSWVHFWPISWPSIFFLLIMVLISSKLVHINSIFILVVGHLLIIKPHYRSRLVLLPHHFYCLLGAIKIKSVILFFLLNLQILKAIIFRIAFFLFDAVRFLLHSGQMEVLFGRMIIFSALEVLILALKLTHGVLHQDEVSILIRTLLSLSLFDSFVKEIYSFFILFLKFCFYALVLDILEPIHLELGQSGVFQSALGLITGGVRVPSLGKLTSFGEFYVVLVEDYLLNIVCWHLSHKKTLHVALFKPLHYFILKAQKLQNLLKHGWSHRSLNIKRLWHLWCRLLSIYLNAFRTISKLVKLSKYLRRLFFKLLLKYFHGLLIIKFQPFHHTIRIPKKRIYLVK